MCSTAECRKGSQSDAGGGECILKYLPVKQVCFPQGLGHPNVVKLHTVLNDPKVDKLYLTGSELVSVPEMGVPFRKGRREGGKP